MSGFSLGVRVLLGFGFLPVPIYMNGAWSLVVFEDSTLERSWVFELAPGQVS